MFGALQSRCVCIDVFDLAVPTQSGRRSLASRKRHRARCARLSYLAAHRITRASRYEVAQASPGQGSCRLRAYCGG